MSVTLLERNSKVASLVEIPPLPLATAKKRCYKTGTSPATRGSTACCFYGRNNKQSVCTLCARYGAWPRRVLVLYERMGFLRYISRLFFFSRLQCTLLFHQDARQTYVFFTDNECILVLCRCIKERLLGWCNLFRVLWAQRGMSRISLPVWDERFRLDTSFGLGVNISLTCEGTTCTRRLSSSMYGGRAVGRVSVTAS